MGRHTCGPRRDDEGYSLLNYLIGFHFFRTVDPEHCREMRDGWLSRRGTRRTQRSHKRASPFRSAIRAAEKSPLFVVSAEPPPSWLVAAGSQFSYVLVLRVGFLGFLSMFLSLSLFLFHPFLTLPSGDLAAALGWLLSRNRILESTAAAPPFGMKNGTVTSRYLGGARIEVRTAH
jgi:hypothetical protein